MFYALCFMFYSLISIDGQSQSTSRTGKIADAAASAAKRSRHIDHRYMSGGAHGLEATRFCVGMKIMPTIWT